MCGYRHKSGEYCNIDVTLFKEDIVNYASNYCYFHQSVYVFDMIYRRLDEFIEALAAFERTKNMDVSKAFSLLKLDHFSDLLKSCPSPDTYYEKFNKLMFEKDKVSFNRVNTSGFYFPVKHRAEVTLNSANVVQIWNNQLVLKNYKFYDIEYIDRLIRDLENNNSNDIRNIYNTLKTYEDEVLKYGFISHSNFKEIKFNISNITFNEDIDIQGWADYLAWDYTFAKCEFNSPKIIIQSAANIEFDEINIIADNELLDISSNSLKITKSSILSKKVVLSASYNLLNLDNTFNSEKLFHKAGEILIYDAGSNDKQSNRSSFKYVDLQRVIFSPYNKENKNANNQNLSLIEFFNCDFLPGHRLKEDHSIDKYVDYYEYCYRYLRKHFDDRGDYIEGNDFHYNYMDIKRVNLKDGLDTILLTTYGFVNGYNTKPWRAFSSMIILVILSAIMIACWGDFETKIATPSQIRENFGYSLLYASSNLLPLLNSDLFIPKDWVSLYVKMIENVVSPILVAMLIMALRNRFRRSKSDDEFK